MTSDDQSAGMEAPEVVDTTAAAVATLVQTAVYVYTTDAGLRGALVMLLIESHRAQVCGARAPSTRAVAEACGVPARTLSRACGVIRERLAEAAAHDQVRD